MRNIAPFALVLLLAGCGAESPTAPSTTPAVNIQPRSSVPMPWNIDGGWVGNMQLTFQGQRFDVYTQARLTQVSSTDRGDTVTGTWTAAMNGNDIGGEITGSLSGIEAETRFSGTVTWNSESALAGYRCFGRATFSGPVAPSIRWESPGFQLDNCRDAPTGLLWTMQPMVQ